MNCSPNERSSSEGTANHRPYPEAVSQTVSSWQGRGVGAPGGEDRALGHRVLSPVACEDSYKTQSPGSKSVTGLKSTQDIHTQLTHRTSNQTGRHRTAP